MNLVEDLLGGDRRALARAITLTENESPAAAELAAVVYPHTGRARVLGITGPPGAGKSTIADGLTSHCRQAGKKVAVVAVDPTSPFTGGAILGDRIRMRRGAADPDVFIRSLATRGHLGGLSWHTGSVIRLLDAAGFDVVLVETVGAGQSEVEIMRYAQTTLVVMVPGLGDEVQAIKAGILEIADVLVVNKADRDGADSLVRELEAMLQLGEHGSWLPPVVRTVATTDDGIGELAGAAERHLDYLRESGALEAWRRRELEAEVHDLVRSIAGQKAFGWAKTAGTWEASFERVLERRADPRTAAEELVQAYLKGSMGA